MTSTRGMSTAYEILEAELNLLLAEELECAIERERTAFDLLTSPLSESLVLFGAGGLGRKALSGLRQVGIEPLAFADNSPSLWGQTIDGVRVLHPEQAAQQFADRAAFVVTIWRAGGSHRFAQSRQQLLSLGCRKIASFVSLFWKHPDVFLPHYCQDLPHKVLEQAEDVRATFALWSDDESRREYVAQVRWRLMMDFDGLPHPVVDQQYFPEDLFSLSPGEVFVDCGAFDGDTIKEFLHRQNGSFRQIVALEPDTSSMQKLRQYVSTLPAEVSERVMLLPVAAAAHAEKALFQVTGSASSALAGSTLRGDLVEVSCAPLAEILVDHAPTYIKMDIEGAELDALRGAREVIEGHLPILAVSAYHQQDHLWRIPAYLRSLAATYGFFLRPHNEEGWDLVCYAVPASRLTR